MQRSAHIALLAWQNKNMIVNGKTAMVTELKGLWLHCFEDAKEDVDYFFEHRFQESGSMVALEDGKIAAMVFLLPARLLTSNETGNAAEGRKAIYIYAFATHPDFRGRGIATQLLEEVRKRNREKGIVTFLCPAKESLIAFYEKRGFYQSFFASSMEGLLEAGADFGMAAGISLDRAARAGLDGKADAVEGMPCVEACGFLEYAAIRAKYLKDGDIAWEEDAVRYAVEENAHSGGECLRILLPDGQYGAALAGIQGKCLKLREVLVPEKFILEEEGYFQKLVAWIAKETASKKRVPLSDWCAVMPGLSGDKGRKLIGMSDEQGIRGYLNLVLD